MMTTQVKLNAATIGLIISLLSNIVFWTWTGGTTKANNDATVARIDASVSRFEQAMTRQSALTETNTEKIIDLDKRVTVIESRRYCEPFEAAGIPCTPRVGQ